jgi:hypothetical protein
LKLVFRIVLFCDKHSFSPSIKAGGYGTAGWAVNGDIIIDLSRLVDIDIEAPLDGGSFTSLRDICPTGSKGKRNVGAPATDSLASSNGKRRREEDDQLRDYDVASLAVADFLGGPPLPVDNIDTPRPIININTRPVIRRRLNVPAQESAKPELNSFSTQDTVAAPEAMADAVFTPSGATEKASSTSQASPFGYLDGDANNAMALDTPSPTSDSSKKQTTNPSGGSPFGYLSDGPSSFQSPLGAQSAYPGQATSFSWRQGTSSLFNEPSHDLLAQSEPIYPHAYVTFGAGVRQKEIDRYTAANPLVGTSLSGMPSSIPYHVPL